MARSLRILVVAVAVFFTAGVPAHVVAATQADCCADECDDEVPGAADEAGHEVDHEGEHDETSTEPPSGSCPTDQHGRCPPYCHGCAGMPHGVAPVSRFLPAVTIPLCRSCDAPGAAADPVTDPLLEGVFHPPRPRA